MRWGVNLRNDGDPKRRAVLDNLTNGRGGVDEGLRQRRRDVGVGVREDEGAALVIA